MARPKKRNEETARVVSRRKLRGRGRIHSIRDKAKRTRRSARIMIPLNRGKK